ncbi:MAG: hypothetical protein QGD92_12975 [Gammaproteobacteria bacterium]|nr:hypothetical protein [Gammaproteobacteria bacterium]
MKHFTLPLIFIVSCCLATSSLADNEFNKIRKDIKVMTKIISGAIESDDECRKCNASVRGSYLAEQGAIFVISSRRSFFKQVFISDDDANVELFELETLADLPEMIGNIMSDVGIAIGEIDFDHDIHEFYTTRLGRHHYARHQSDLDRQSRSDLRSLRREMRQLRDEIRDQEIALIRAEDTAKQDLEQTIRGLEENIRELEQKGDQLNDVLDRERERKAQERKKIMRTAQEARQKQNTMLEHSVLATLCDYGASLKNLPSNERVTLLFEREGRRWAENRTKVYVLKKKDLLACQQDDLDKNGLIEKSISYNF